MNVTNQVPKAARGNFSMAEYFAYLKNLLPTQGFNIGAVVDEICRAIERGNSIWIMGNGGSASTAEHFETDLSFVRAGNTLSAVKASALTSNSSLISAIANDIGFENIFSHQLRRKASAGDLCILISASGNSANLISAIEVSKSLGLISIGILGFDGGRIADLVEYSIFVKTEIGKYGPVEDIHLAICHAVSELVGKELSKMAGK